ncbi:MAG: 3-dehydroquinate synthase [Treponema sp.]|nr:3-dehydroquinate synthase [Treponema sp.]
MDFNSYSISYKEKIANTNIEKVKDFESLIEKYKVGQDSKTQRHFFITDATVASLPIMQNFTAMFDDDKCKNDCLLILGSGEPYKIFETVMTIVEKALTENFSIKDSFVAIGGGVICDLTGFAASIFKRGIQVDFIPTTLLAMIDSSIGGKTSCNFKNQKNIIGTYYPAKNIYLISDFLKSLPDIQIKSGLAEALKAAIISDSELFNIFKDKKDLIDARDPESISQIIEKASLVKAKIVEQDFYEENIRSYLNLGHTFAYALESVVGMGVITHGETVAWGIGRAVTLSCQKDYCSESFKNQIFSILEAYGYEVKAIPPIVTGGGVSERILEAMHKDKKTLNDKIRIVMPKNIGDIIIEEVDDKDILAALK